MTRSEEQAARNEVIFREANERIAAKRDELRVDDVETPFLCECDDPACTEILRLASTEYAHVRSNPRWFVVADGHVEPAASTVERAGRYTIIEKSGAGGAIAAAEDERSRR